MFQVTNAVATRVVEGKLRKLNISLVGRQNSISKKVANNKAKERKQGNIRLTLL
jgi:hypothetical protein